MAPSRPVPSLNFGALKEQASNPDTSLAGPDLSESNQGKSVKSTHEWKLLSPRSLAALKFTNELDTILTRPQEAPHSPRLARLAPNPLRLPSGELPQLQVNQLQVQLKDETHSAYTPSPRLAKPNFSEGPTRDGGKKEVSRLGSFPSPEINEFCFQIKPSPQQNVDPKADVKMASACKTEVQINDQTEASKSSLWRREELGKKDELLKPGERLSQKKRVSAEVKTSKKGQPDPKGSGMWRLDDASSQEINLDEGLVSNSFGILKKEGNSAALTSPASEEVKVRRGLVKPKLVKPLELLTAKEKASPRGKPLTGPDVLLEGVPTPLETSAAKPEADFPVTWTGEAPLLPQPNHGKHTTYVPPTLLRSVSILNLPADISKMSPRSSANSSPRTPLSTDSPPSAEKHFPMAPPQLSSLTQRLLEKEEFRSLPGYGATHWLVYDRDNLTDPTAFAPVKPLLARAHVEHQKANPLHTGFENLKIVSDLKGVLGSLVKETEPLQPASPNALTRVVNETNSTPSTPRASDTLRFESRFESGNLRKATLVDENEYDLMLQPDVGMSGHTQWFYFGVRNMRPKIRYKFNILNLLKPKSLFQEGMRVLVYSARLASAIKQGWFRTGDEIAYFPNKVKKKGTCHYTLTFVLEAPFADDTLYLAYCYPYTHSDLQAYLKVLCTDSARARFVTRELLCHTLSGNRCDLLTITSPGAEDKDKPKKRAVVLSARVHPGESNASWMMKGALDFLTSARPEAEKLRETTIFKVVPMLNPDGVINGNHRCSLAQVDLNRIYTSPSQERHPEVWHTKEMVKKLAQERDVVAYVDLHGHSAKKNVFMYGCENKHAPILTNESPPPLLDFKAASAFRLAERVFPFLVSKAAPDAFSYSDCNFRVQKSKESTARVVGWRELGLLNSLTIEASFAGPSKGRVAFHHFTMNDLMGMGAALCRGLLDYCTVAETPSPEHSIGEVVKEVEAVTQPGQGDQNGSEEDSEAGSSASDDVAPHDLRQAKGGLAWQLGGRKSAHASAPSAAVRAPKKGKKRRKKRANSLEELVRKMDGSAKVHSEIAASVSAMLAKGNGSVSKALKPRRKSEGFGFGDDEASAMRRLGSSKRLPIDNPTDLEVEGLGVRRVSKRDSKSNLPLPKLLEKGLTFKLSPVREPSRDLDLSWLPPL